MHIERNGPGAGEEDLSYIDSRYRGAYSKASPAQRDAFHRKVAKFTDIKHALIIGVCSAILTCMIGSQFVGLSFGEILGSAAVLIVILLFAFAWGKLTWKPK